MKREQAKDWSKSFRLAMESNGMTDDLKRCLACGKCVGACPVAAITPSYNPRQIIREILLGNEERLIVSEEIWQCFWCFGCYGVCPSEIKFPFVILLLRYYALRHHAGKKYVMVFKRFVDKAKSDGMTFLPGNPKRLEKIKELRRTLGLSPLREVSDAAKAEYALLYERSGTGKWLEALEAGPGEEPRYTFREGRIFGRQKSMEEAGGKDV